MKQLLFPEFEEYIQKQGITQGAIMNIGIDNLREINAAYGIETGDEILSILSEILINYTGIKNITRLVGSDEFVLFFDESVDTIEGERIFALIQKQIIKTCQTKSYFFTISAGMVIFQNINQQTHILLTCAEYALNRAKEQGKNCLFVYEKEQFLNYTKKMQLLQDLQNSVQNNFNGFELYYQPIISLEERSMISAETLLRWINPKYPKISPAEFIPILEESGLIMEVGHFIIENAMKQAVIWSKKCPDFSLHINLSYVQFQQSDLAEQVRLLMEQTNVSPKQIVFEITESGFVGKDLNVSKQIEKLRDMGFSLALDDFGTGYSNFIYLKDQNFNIVKLDRTFIAESLAKKNKRELLSHIVETIHSIGMKVCFEGIETSEDFLKLNELGPESIQGFFFGTPVPAVTFEQNFNKFLHKDILDKIPRYKKSDSSMAYLMNEINEQEQENKKNKLQMHRSLAFFLPILLIILLILGIVNYFVNRSILKHQLDENMIHSLNTSMNTLESKFYETKELTNDLALYVKESYKTVELTNYEKMLSDIVDSRKQIAGAGIWFEKYAFQNKEIVCPYVYLHDGKKILTYYYGGNEYNYFDQEYYKKTKELRASYVTNPYFDSTMDSQIITFSSPIINDSGEFLGVITVDLYVTDIENIVQNLNPDENGYAFICDKDSNILCGYDDVPQEIMDKMTNSEGVFNYNLKNTDYEVYYDVLDTTGWKAGILFNTQNIYSPIKKMAAIIIVTIFIALLASAFIIIALLMALNRQKHMEFEQKKSLNEIHFKALRSSYYMIIVVDINTENIKVVYESPIAKQAYIIPNSYENFIEQGKTYVFEDDLNSFLQFSNLSNLKENLTYRDFISQDIRIHLNGQSPEWVELTASRINDLQSNDKETNQFLFMIRDIHAVKSKLLLAQEENQQLITKLQNKNQELFKLGITDSLTGIYNREGLNYYAPSIFNEASKDDKKLFFMLADVNKLKTINDSMGHIKGDKVICEAAYVISHTEFKELIAARTGGDEFVLFGAVDASKEDFPQLVEKSISKFITESENTSITYGISVGYFWGKMDGNKKLDYYYNYADKMMYNRKKK